MAWVDLKSGPVTIDAVIEYRWSFPYGLLLSVKMYDTGETSMAIELGEHAQEMRRSPTQREQREQVS